MSQEGKPRKRQPFYPVEVKRASVARLAAGDRAAEIAGELGCRPNRIYAWREECEAHGGHWPGPGGADDDRPQHQAARIEKPSLNG